MISASTCFHSIRRMDQDSVSPTRARRTSSCLTFQHARRRRPHRDDSPLFDLRTIQRIRRFVRDAVVLGVHRVIFDSLGRHRFERAKTDVERDRRSLHASCGRVCSSSIGVKCNPAVGAAIEPSAFANTV